MTAVALTRDDATLASRRPPAATPNLRTVVATQRGRSDSIILSRVADLALQSGAFDHGRPIPGRHSCEGEDLSPPLAWSGAPADTRALALVVDDPDAPAGTFAHWLGWALDPAAEGLGEGEAAPVEGATTSGPTATAGPARRPATAATATPSASTRSTPTPVWGPAPASASSSAPSRATRWPQPS
jgi:phosphatidylethanolamine-binding protein (PEBP) family uncharacterized protein